MQRDLHHLGEQNILELSGEDHKCRGALVSFLKPESLKQYVGKMDEEVKKHLELHWQGKQQVKVRTLMLPKVRHMELISNVQPNEKALVNAYNSQEKFIGIRVERGARKDKFVACFQEMIEGMWSIPINLPLTRYNRSLRARTRVQNMVKDLIREKRLELEQKGASTHQDLITCMLSIHNENNEQVITEKEIVDNVILVMVAGHDTSSVLITFIMRLLANEPTIYAAVLQEQEEIVKSKPSGEFLTWEDLAKMKYTWRVSMETLRMLPPVFGGFRKALKDIEYGGYLIPKGWQVFWVSPMTHMDSSIFPEPSKFDPSRFENQASVPPYCFVAFRGGPRICPGYEFARIETLVTIHYLITHFTWKLCADNSFSRDPMPVPTQGLPIQLVPKKTF
uniref:Cytochrome P450 n=1 Tax=Fagus sylvatica TaxID=28930 RepID=A0A2N9F2Q7_FAGSY